MVEAAKDRMQQIQGLSPLYNMGSYEFERWAKLINYGTGYSIDINSGKYSSLNDFFSILKELYRQWHGIMESRAQKVDWVKDFDALFKKAELLHSGGSLRRSSSGKTSVNMNFVAILMQIWSKLHDFKYAAKLSVPMAREYSDEDRFKQALE